MMANRPSGSQRMVGSHESMTSSRRMLLEHDRQRAHPVLQAIPKPNVRAVGMFPHQDVTPTARRQLPAGARAHNPPNRGQGKAIIKPSHGDNEIF